MIKRSSYISSRPKFVDCIVKHIGFKMSSRKLLKLDGIPESHPTA